MAIIKCRILRREYILKLLIQNGSLTINRNEELVNLDSTGTKKTTHLHYATQSATYDISNAKKVELNDKHLYHFKKIILSFYHVIFHGFRVLKINAISLSLKKYFMAKK